MCCRCKLSCVITYHRIQVVPPYETCIIAVAVTESVSMRQTEGLVYGGRDEYIRIFIHYVLHSLNMVYHSLLHDFSCLTVIITVSICMYILIQLIWNHYVFLFCLVEACCTEYVQITAVDSKFNLSSHIFIITPFK